MESKGLEALEKIKKIKYNATELEIKESEKGSSYVFREAVFGNSITFWDSESIATMEKKVTNEEEFIGSSLEDYEK